MDGYITLLLIILGLVWAILNIILFFKIWHATNNIEAIANKYLYNRDSSGYVLAENQIDYRDIKENDIVVEKLTGNELIVKSVLPNGRYICWNNRDKTITEKYVSSELLTLEEFATLNKNK